MVPRRKQFLRTDSVDWLVYERAAKATGKRLIAGVDEAGRGPLAGPVVAAAVILADDRVIEGVIDSKLLTPEAREILFPQIINSSVAFAISAASTKMIDKIGILPATMLAMKRAVSKLSPAPDYILVDGTMIPDGINVPGEAVVRGDRSSRSIAAASILAKVIRDRLMINLSGFYPEFGFAGNKGYGTAAHLRSIDQYGPTVHHRFSFSPIKQYRLKLDES